MPENDGAITPPKCRRHGDSMKSEYGSWSGELLWRCSEPYCPTIVYEKDLHA